MQEGSKLWSQNLGPQMSTEIGQFIVSIFAIENFISAFPKHDLHLGKMKTAADIVEATTWKLVDAWGNQYPSQRSLQHPWEGPVPRTLQPCLTLTTRLYLHTASFSEMSVRLSVEMTAALTSAAWLSDTLTSNPSRSRQLYLSSRKKPKVCSVYVKGLCYLRHGKITLYYVMFPCSVLTGQIWQILTACCCLPQQAEGVIWSHSYPKAFVQLQRWFFFLLFSNFLSRKSGTWNTYSSLATKSSLPALVKHSFWSSYLGERWDIPAV